MIPGRFIVYGFVLLGLLLSIFGLWCLIVWGYIDQWGEIERGLSADVLH